MLPVFRSPEAQARFMAVYDEALKQWPVPYAERQVATGLGETHVIASGPEGAPPVVLLHPSGSPSTIWRRNVAALSAHHRVFAVDTIGEPNKSVLRSAIHRRTQKQQYADWMADLISAVDVGPVHLVGNSFGGFIALATALRHPELVHKLVLISPAASFTPMWSWYWHFVPANLRRQPLTAYDWIWQGFPMEADLAQQRAIAAEGGRWRHGFPTVFSDDELHSLRAPTLLLIGDREVIYRPERAIERAQRLVKDLRAEIIPNANHAAEYTAAEAVDAALLRFFSPA